MEQWSFVLFRVASQQDYTKQKQSFTTQQKQPHVVSKQEISLQLNNHTPLYCLTDIE